MNAGLKIFLIILNVAMLWIGIIWYRENYDNEPLIVCIGQVVTLVGLLFERRLTKVATKRISNNSTVDIKAQSGDKITTKHVDASSVKVEIEK